MVYRLPRYVGGGNPRGVKDKRKAKPKEETSVEQRLAKTSLTVSLR